MRFAPDQRRKFQHTPNPAAWQKSVVRLPNGVLNYFNRIRALSATYHTQVGFEGFVFRREHDLGFSAKQLAVRGLGQSRQKQF